MGMRIRLAGVAFGLFAATAWTATADPRLELADKVQRAILSEERLRVYDWIEYRIEGELQLVGAPGSEAASVGAGAGHDLLVSARKEQWGQLSDPAREQFFWNGPGPYSGAVEVPAGGRNAETGAVLEAPPSFLLMLLHPTRVHYLRLTDNFAQVDELVAGGASGPRQWAARRVNP